MPSENKAKEFRGQIRQGFKYSIMATQNLRLGTIWIRSCIKEKCDSYRAIFIIKL